MSLTISTSQEDRQPQRNANAKKQFAFDRLAKYLFLSTSARFEAKKHPNHSVSAVLYSDGEKESGRQKSE
ncbi:hypothetical protein T01_10621 [Trichinella spiralis]|uniref:Uncharacterized protein n=1 Tax=Trichinella spiralis TaxID=6334 RepID=A0A0V1BIB6_TRISP|nr:hypothetical protein T01_10621 [Trichinella spiralis]